MKLQQVHLRINDAATGQPTPVRLRITDADGTYYAPHGRLAEFVSSPNQEVGGNVYLGTKPWAYIGGACEILLPPGKLHIEITKGPEYKPIDEEIELRAGKMALRWQMERWSDVRKQGWHSGDTRVHFLSPDAALLEGQAEDLAVVNILAREVILKDAYGKSLTAIPNILSFSGQMFARQTSTHGVAVNTQNAHPQLGTLGLLHCHRVVYPLTFGSPSGKDDWTLADWCDQCHRKKGLVVWTDPLHQTPDFLYGEPLADLILGKVDAFEMTFWEDSPFDALPDYYRLLDAELVVPLVGASGKDSNGLPMGMMRTYAQIPVGQPFDYAGWIEAVRAGRTFVSNSPLIHLTIDDVVPSSSWQVDMPDKPLQIHVDAKSSVAFGHLELLFNGEVIAETAPADESPCRAELHCTMRAGRSGWLAARCRGDIRLPSRPAVQSVFAHTSPVVVRLAKSPNWAKPEAVQRLLDEVDRMLRWAHEKACCDTPRDRERLIHVFEEARTVLLKKLSV